MLNKLNYKGCQACYGCKKKSEKCILNDDLTAVLDNVKEANVLVMATGVYYGEVTSQLKAFIDRTFSFLVPDYMTSSQPSRLTAGKKLVFIISQGQSDETIFADIFPRYEQFFKWYGYTDTHLIRACGLNKDDNIEDHKDIIQLAEETARMVIIQDEK